MKTKEKFDIDKFWLKHDPHGFLFDRTAALKHLYGRDVLWVRAGIDTHGKHIQQKSGESQGGDPQSYQEYW